MIKAANKPVSSFFDVDAFTVHQLIRGNAQMAFLSGKAPQDNPYIEDWRLSSLWAHYYGETAMGFALGLLPKNIT